MAKIKPKKKTDQEIVLENLTSIAKSLKEISAMNIRTEKRLMILLMAVVDQPDDKPPRAKEFKAIAKKLMLINCIG